MNIISCWRIKQPHAGPAIRKSRGLVEGSAQTSVPPPSRASQTLLFLHLGATVCVPGSAAQVHCEACAMTRHSVRPGALEGTLGQNKFFCHRPSSGVGCDHNIWPQNPKLGKLSLGGFQWLLYVNNSSTQQD